MTYNVFSGTLNATQSINQFSGTSRAVGQSGVCVCIYECANKNFWPKWPLT